MYFKKDYGNLFMLLLGVSIAGIVALQHTTPEAAAHSLQSDNTFEIRMDEDGFRPQKVKINQGTNVVFKNYGEKSRWPAANLHPTHRFYPDSGIEKCGTSEEKEIFDACKEISPSGHFDFTFNHTGVWRYHDHMDPKLKGAIEVINKKVVDGDASAQVMPHRKIRFWQRLGTKLINFFSSIFSLPPNDVAIQGVAINDVGRTSQLKSGAKNQQTVDGAANTSFGTVISVSNKTVKNLGENSLGSSTKYKFDKTVAEDADTIFHNYELLAYYIKRYGLSKAIKQLHNLEIKGVGDCHQSAHEAGRFGYEQSGGKAFGQCSAECHSGCYHGATEAYFRDKGTGNLIKDLKLICDTGENVFFTHQCFHGIGHGLMAWSDYELNEALDACDKLPKPSDRESCYTGVFMENIVGGLAKEAGHFTEYLSEDAHFPCSVVKDKYKGACYFLQSSRMVQLFGGDFKRIAEECNKAPAAFQHSCFGSMGRDVGAWNSNNPSGAIEACSHSPRGIPRRECILGAMQDHFWDPSGASVALDFCYKVKDSEEKQACYGVIFSRAPEIINSKKELVEFCGKVTEETFKVQCQKQVLKK